MTESTPSWQALLDTAQHNNLQPHNRFAQLATVQCGSEPRPAVRTVTVRFFMDDGRLLITSDMRNEKVMELAANPACELCWYFTESREQFRLSGRAQVIDAAQAGLEAKLDGALQRTWSERSVKSQQSITWPQPKRHLESIERFELPAPSKPPVQMALILIDVGSVDYLDLTSNPHQRVLFTKLGGQWMPRAVNP